MNKIILLIGLFLLAGCNAPKEVAGDGRSLDFTADWAFRLGDDTAASRPDYNDADWRKLNLPHDWAIEGEFSKDNPSGTGGGALPGGIGWYRKTFTADKADEGKRYRIDFDGAYMNSTVYINGHELGTRPYGYISFSYDLTPYIKWGEENVLAVRVDNAEQPNSRWYSGCGIYRNVWLTKLNPAHVAQWGTYVTAEDVSKNSARLKIRTKLQYDAEAQMTDVVLQSRLVDADGNVVGEAVSEAQLVPLAPAEVEQEINVKNPRLWSIDTPYMYRVESILKDKQTGEALDRYYTPTGIRTFRFDVQKGFILNGEQVKINGVCMHHDQGCLGTAVNTRAIQRQLEILKEMGCNGIRCSHNPPAPELLDLCDRMGFIVMDEAFDMWRKKKTAHDYARYFNEWHERDLNDFILRDRNHPSVILWSIGNELAEAKLKDDTGIERAGMLQDFVHQLDPSRLVMLALQPGFEDKFASVTDVLGYNYMEPRLIYDKKKYPERICLISESYPYYSSIREFDSRDYDEKNPWNYVMEHEYICGSFMWTGVDYIGESSGWPSKGWPSAPFDMCMSEKPRGGYFRALWNEKPFLGLYVIDYNLDEDPGKDHWQAPGMVHDWTFPYQDARVMQIQTPSNCDEVMLIDPRGKVYGPRKPRDYINNTIKWNQPYRPGKVVVIGYKDGIEVCRDSIQTSGNKAVRFTLKADREQLKADGQDLSHISLNLYDEQGIPIRIDDRQVKVTVEGNGRLMGIDSGEMRRSERFSSHILPTYLGRAQIVVQAGRMRGQLKVKVEVEGMASQELVLLVG